MFTTSWDTGWRAGHEAASPEVRRCSGGCGDISCALEMGVRWEGNLGIGKSMSREGQRLASLGFA